MIPAALLFLSSMVPGRINAGEENSRTVVFLPPPPTTHLFLANPAEPRTGLRLDFATSRMKLDIGLALDLLQISPSEAATWRFGAFIFAYGLTTSSEGLRLQVDAIDGFFGGHISYRHGDESSFLRGRLRIMHRSAHLVDGHIDPATGAWKDGREPIPFTKDFGEFALSFGTPLFGGILELYSGIGYSTLIRPDSLERLETLHGIQWQSTRPVACLVGTPVNLYGAYHLSVTGIPEYTGMNDVEGGIKFGSWSERGVRIFLAYHAGPDVFGQYYNQRVSSWNIGFTLEIM